jgi:hypothetical protein
MRPGWTSRLGVSRGKRRLYLSDRLGLGAALNADANGRHTYRLYTIMLDKPLIIKGARIENR